MDAASTVYHEVKTFNWTESSPGKLTLDAVQPHTPADAPAPSKIISDEVTLEHSPDRAVHFADPLYTQAFFPCYDSDHPRPIRGEPHIEQTARTRSGQRNQSKFVEPSLSRTVIHEALHRRFNHLTLHDYGLSNAFHAIAAGQGKDYTFDALISNFERLVQCDANAKYSEYMLDAIKLKRLAFNNTPPTVEQILG